MTAPFTLITTHHLTTGTADDVESYNRRFRDLVEDNEPEMLGYHVFMDEEQSQVSFIMMFADACAADAHMRLAGELIAEGHEFTSPVRIEAYGGIPGPILGEALAANSDQGVPLSIKPENIGGFHRAMSSR